ncbi:MAG: polysaccharide deacetylase family protein [Clostridia bacterium]|nr:polysaccharide deacetylase family protein [Clostridia bacterium]
MVAGIVLPSKPTTVLASANIVNGVYYSGNTETKNVSLMINVYWGTEFLDSMLKTLKDHNVKTTFFVGGSWVNDNPEVLKKVYAQGHEIANHGFYHKDHENLTAERNREEISYNHQVVKATIGVDMNLFAPPSGSYSKTTVKVANDLGYKTIMWTRDTIDWRDHDADLIYSRATSKMSGGDLILMHPTAQTAQALPKILDYIEQNGFLATTVSETLR